MKVYRNYKKQLADKPNDVNVNPVESDGHYYIRTYSG